MRKFILFVIASTGLAMLVISQAGAAVVTFTGFDDGQTAPIGPLSAAAQASFLTAVGSANTITFETPLPSGVSLSFGAGSAITNVSECNFQLCGGNTTPSGAFFLSQFGGTATFTFATPINSFGAYFSGIQFPNNFIIFNDGSPHSIMLPFDTNSSKGGMAFVGFTDFGAAITSVSITLPTDIIGVDDVLFASSAASVVPLPGALPLFATGLGALGLLGWRRKKKLAA